MKGQADLVQEVSEASSMMGGHSRVAPCKDRPATGGERSACNRSIFFGSLISRRKAALEENQVWEFVRGAREMDAPEMLIACLDVVITVDTSVAHLAGALGCPTWTLLSYTPDYRWLLDREDSPWYPNMRPFRQGPRRDWGEVIDRVRAELGMQAL